jgi:choline dehydrogenase-like flavoprotein
MIIDFRRADAPTDIDCDLCIVGGGMVGLTVARAFAGANLRVCVIETGARRADPDAIALNQVAADDHPYPDPIGTRPRQLGGSTALWGSHCAPLEDEDFNSLQGNSAPGWPFGVDHLRPYYERAQAVLGLGPYVYDDRAWPIYGERAPQFDPALIRVRFWQFRSPRRFPLVLPLRMGPAYAGELDRAANLRVFTNVTATRIKLSQDGRKAVGLDLRSLTGRHGRLTGKMIVIACGTIETARLLLASNDVMPNGVGNQHDLVGRFFQEHPHAQIATIAPNNPEQFLESISIRHRRQGAVWQPLLTLTPQLRRARDVLGASASIDAIQSFESPTRAAAEVLRHILEGRRPPHMLAHLRRLVRQPANVARNIWRRLSDNRGIMPEFDSIIAYARIEQEPNPESRVTLTSDRDRLDMPRARISWRLGERERRTIQVLAETLVQEFTRLGLARIEPDEWVRTGAHWPKELKGGPHHAGTARMSDDPKSGVVDRHGKVHGVENLYLGGASVFPISGYINPGLTVTAMALRLADHLTALHGADQTARAP